MHSFNSRHTALAAACLATTAVAFAPSLASAQVDPDEGDIGLRVVDGKIDTTLVAEDGGGFDGPAQRAFAAFLGTREENSNDADIYSPPPPGSSGTESFVTNTPGFDSLPGTFAGGSSVGLDVTSPTLLSDNVVRYDVVSNTLVPTDVQVQAFFSQPARLARTTDPDGSTPLFLPVFAGSEDEQETGRFHRHYNYALFEGDPDPSTGDLSQPTTNGVYVLEADLVSTDSSVGRSDPFFLVFGYNTPGSDSVAAINYLNATFVPEPTGLAALGLGGLALLRRRRVR